MAIKRPGATTTHRLSTEAKRRMARERLSCLPARNDGTAVRGRKPVTRRCGQGVEAKPSFGQIRYSERLFGALVVKPTEMNDWHGTIMLTSTGTR
jgi:hypothetical protein